MSYERTTFHMDDETWHHTVALARHLRQNESSGEVELWNLLRGRQIAGVKFRRQHPIGPYIVDFYAPAFRLAIEVDGPVHEGREGRDEARQRRLEQEGIRFLRLKTAEVAEREGCIRKIQEALGSVW